MFKIVAMLNAYVIINWNTRCGLAGVDLNRVKNFIKAAPNDLAFKEND